MQMPSLHQDPVVSKFISWIKVKKNQPKTDNIFLWDIIVLVMMMNQSTFYIILEPTNLYSHFLDL